MTLHRCVGALIVDQNRFLLGLRAPTRTFYPNVWDVFGGHIEPDEEPEQTLVRELQEELGITPTLWTHLRMLHLTDDERDIKVQLDCYVVRMWDGTPTNVQPEEHARIAWVTLDEAKRLNLGDPSYQSVFAEALA